MASICAVCAFLILVLIILRMFKIYCETLGFLLHYKGDSWQMAPVSCDAECFYAQAKTAAKATKAAADVAKVAAVAVAQAAKEILHIPQDIEVLGTIVTLAVIGFFFGTFLAKKIIVFFWMD
jgi:hypothetical protein